MFGSLVESLVESPAEQLRRRLEGRLQEINAMEERFASCGDQQLVEEAETLRRRATNGETLEELLVEAFALVREASKRTLQLRHFDVQILGGIVLHEGQVAEMATGEGKTLVAILPAFLNALTGDGVHVVTTNDYLARRDAAWVGRVLRFLGLTVGVIQSDMTPSQKRAAYRCDVTYVTNQQLGFDYLRDQMANENPFSCAIVDEADSVLIDEGRTPLVVSAQAEVPSEKYSTALEIAASLERDVDYTVLEKEKTCTLTELGEQKTSNALGIQDLYDPQDPWAPYVVNSLTAKELYVRERQYIVRDAKASSGVIVVDEFTGRPVEGRSWSDGLQQAIEAKEGARVFRVEISKEAIILASISYQCLFRLYKKLAGMTGTASTEKEEFESIYDLKVSPIPSNKPCQRTDEDDEVYTTNAGKWAAVVRGVREAFHSKRPVLVGTTSIENSELLSEQLDAEGVPHHLLNAKPENASREAEIIAAGGRLGAVTISTNMAGRGTDIVLGGDAKSMAKLHLQAALTEASGGTREDVSLELCLALPEELSQEMSQAASKMGGASEVVMAAVCDGIGHPSLAAQEKQLQLLKEVFNKACQARDQFDTFDGPRAAPVKQLGGLKVIGTERHEAQRIDRQLRGRAGRQGDPGTTRFCLSLADKALGDARGWRGHGRGPRVMMGKIRRDTMYYLFTFEPRPLWPLESTEGEPMIDPSEALVDEVQGYLRSLPRPRLAKVCGGRGEPSALSQLLGAAGITRREEQIAWLQKCPGVTLLEDSFARSTYASLEEPSPVGLENRAVQAER
eukprot:Skav210143  [mRNA]  locus=scaffold268:76254:83933:+ [translate_table: standard]